MRREQKINLYYWLSAAAFAVALMAGADLIQGIAAFIKWTLFLGGLALAIVLFIIAVATAWREEQATKSKQRPMLALIGMVVFGLGFLACASWFFWPASPTNSYAKKKVAGNVPAPVYSLWRLPFRP